MSEEKNIFFRANHIIQTSDNPNSHFSKAPLFPDLQDETLHIWRVILPLPDALQNKFHSTLSPDEKERLSKFHFEFLKESYIAARGGLREILAKYCSIPPKELNFSYTDYGKPFLKNSALSFNLSHSGNCILYAITKEVKIGIDIEEIKLNQPIDHLSIAKQFFSKQEYAQLLTLSDQEQALAFYRCWTRKEAFVKAIGLGLHYPVEKLHLGFSEMDDVSLSLADEGLQMSLEKPNTWKISEIVMNEPGMEKYVASLASEQAFKEIHYWDFSLDPVQA